MSLINQMLRDLEQRNNQTPQKAAQAMNVPIAVKPAGRKPGRLWLWLLMALPPAYLWHQNSADLPTQQPISPVNTVVTAEPKQAATTAAAEPPAKQNQNPLPASAQINERIELPVLPAISTVQSPNALPESQEPTVKQSIGSKQAKPADKPQATAPKQAAATLASAPIARPKAAKTPMPKDEADALYRQAQHSASALMAKENLKEALQLEPRHLPARTLLLQTLMKSHAGAELNEFVDDSLQLFPSNLLFIKTRAHLYVQQKNFAAAVNLLERVDADTVNDSAYLALLAAGYQQLQRFPQAVRIYRQLTQIQPDAAENWLGLAIAQDKLNQTQSAAQAYRQALDKKTLNAEVVNYIKQRLTALNPAL